MFVKSMLQEVFKFVGTGLLILGGASGFVLFLRAAIGREKISEGPGIPTLWVLFVLCLLAGLALLYFFVP